MTKKSVYRGQQAWLSGPSGTGHLPKNAPKRTGRRGVKPVDDEPPVPTTEDVEAFLDGAASTEEKRAEKRKKKTPELLKELRLPGMEDSAIDEIEDSAKRYASVRDKRMALTEQESGMKEQLLTLMHRHGKKQYSRDGIEIKIVPEGEKIKVRIKDEE